MTQTPGKPCTKQSISTRCMRRVAAYMHDMEEVPHTLECPGRKQLNFEVNRSFFMGIEVTCISKIKCLQGAVNKTRQQFSEHLGNRSSRWSAPHLIAQPPPPGGQIITLLDGDARGVGESFECRQTGWTARRNFLIEQSMQCDLLNSTAAEQRVSVQEWFNRPHAATEHAQSLLFIWNKAPRNSHTMWVFKSDSFVSVDRFFSPVRASVASVTVALIRGRKRETALVVIALHLAPVSDDWILFQLNETNWCSALVSFVFWWVALISGTHGLFIHGQTEPLNVLF